MSEETAAAPSAGKRWTQWIVRLLGVLLLVWVVRSVAWRDSIVLRDPPPNGTTLVGEIVDERLPRPWTSQSTITFRAVDGAEKQYAASDLSVDKATGAPDVNEGLIRIVRNSEKWMIVLGVLLMGFITQIGVTRWWLLLRAQDIRIPYGLANRLTFLGFFFNNVVPGPTGGDVVKALYIARRTHKRAQAVVTVVIDRVVGIVALALIAACALLTKLDNPRFRELALFIGLFLGGVAVGSMLFFSRRVRRLIRFESWSARLPGGALIRQADEAVFLWRNHKRDVVVALFMSFANQLAIQGMMALLFAAALHVTTATGEPLSWTTYMVVLPVAFIVSALPMLPGGWGVREAAFVGCFWYVGVERNPAIALSVLNGMTMLFWSLLGGVYFLLDRGLAAPADPPAPPENA